MNINGFEIEKFNQYDLPEGKKQSTCPLCSHKRKKKTDKCLLIFWNTGLARCFHCDKLLQIHIYKSNSKETEYKLPEWTNNTKLPDNIVKWFDTRKISQFVLRILKITSGKEWMPQYKKEVETIQFNYFRNNQLVNIKYRTSDKKFKLYLGSELIFYNLDSIRTSKEVYIVEGEIDCMSIMECGIYNVISVPNGAGSKDLKYLDNCINYFENKEKIYLLTDNDKSGIELRNELVRRLGAERCFIFEFKEKDINEYLVNNGKEKLEILLKNPIEYPLENIVSINDIKDLWVNDEAKGYIIGLKYFDEIFSTYTKQFIVVTGIPTHGKSDFVDQMTVGYALNYDWKIAYASPENKPEKIHYQKLWKKVSGNRAANSNDEYKLINDWIKDHFFLMDFEKGFNLINVLNKTKELIKRKGLNCLVIDPYNKVPNKESKLLIDSVGYIREYLFLIDEFCRMNDILIILVVHPRKPAIGIAYEPTFYDVKGGTEFYDMSPHGLLIHRDFDKETVKIKVLKCKFQNLGVNGAEINYCWNQINGRYTELDNNPTSTGALFDNSNWLVKEEKMEIINDIDPNYEILTDKMPF